jgi:hypothetical protein
VSSSQVLAKGAAVDPLQLMCTLVGQPPTSDALLQDARRGADAVKPFIAARR